MELADHPLPGGQYRLSRADNQALCRAVACPTDHGERAHPIFYYIASQGAMGLSVADLLSLCDFDVKDGPMMTESEVHFDGELEQEKTYDVSGKILSLQRRSSRTFGAVDVLKFELSIMEEGGTRVARCINSWILPRPEARA